MKLILLGAPGAGKGTQAEILCKKLGIPTISTGNILRAAIKDGTPTGMKAKSFIDAGQLVPDEVIIGIVSERLAQADCAGGYILDGVPRTIAQAEALERSGIAFDAVVSIEISEDEILRRMGGRRVCEACGSSYNDGSSFSPSRISNLSGALIQEAHNLPLCHDAIRLHADAPFLFLIKESAQQGLALEQLSI